jgi:uncharacterized protein (UPF0371 family)
LKILKLLKDVAFIYCVNAKDINSKKLLGDFNLSYEQQTLKDLSELKKNKLPNPVYALQDILEKKRQTSLEKF